MLNINRSRISFCYPALTRKEGALFCSYAGVPGPHVLSCLLHRHTVVFRPYLHGVLRIMHIFTQSHLHYDVIYLNRQSGACRTEILLLY